MNIKLSDWLDSHLPDFDIAIQMAIFEFMVHIKTHGIRHLKGRINPQPT